MTLALTRVGEADHVVRQSLGEQGVPTRSMGTRDIFTLVAIATTAISPRRKPWDDPVFRHPSS